MSSIPDPIRHGYTTVKVVLDELRGKTVTVGVVAWDAEAEWFGIRALGAGERIPTVNTHLRTFTDIAIRQLLNWARQGQVPYAKRALHPYEGDFWQAASRIMTTAVRLDAPRAMDPMKDHEQELDSLFEALAQPLISAERQSKRIDGVITHALGDAAGIFRKGVDLPAFHGRQETVLRAVVGTQRTVIVEGVNLAAANARKEADALVSKLMRIQEAQPTSRPAIVVGYMTSPGGLNGETDLRDWIRAKVTDKVFDIVTEQKTFQEAAVEEVHSAGLSSNW